MEIGRVEAGRRENAGIYRGAEGEVSANADAHGAELAGALRMVGEIRHRAAGVIVVGSELLRGLEHIAALGAGLVVGENFARRLKLVVDLRHDDNEAVTREEGRGPANGTGDLENFRVEENARIFSWRRGPKYKAPHGPGRRSEVGKLRIDDCHGAKRLKRLTRTER